jgi:hypothetical protein
MMIHIYVKTATPLVQLVLQIQQMIVPSVLLVRLRRVVCVSQIVQRPPGQILEAESLYAVLVVGIVLIVTRLLIIVQHAITDPACFCFQVTQALAAPVQPLTGLILEHPIANSVLPPA